VTDLLDEAPDDIEEALVSWLTPVNRAAISRRTGDPLPFILIRHLDGSEKVDEGIADHIVTIRTLCARSGGEVAARNESLRTHRAMLELARYLPEVSLSGGRIATIDYLKVTESPRWMAYEDDQILCKLARYQIGLSYAPAP
jgi:hypothetical protein